MKKFSLIIITLALSVSVFAQSKMLSSKQLMTGSLYPRATMRGAQFVGNTNQIAYIQDTVLYMGQPGKVKACLTLSQLNKVLASADMEALSYMPSMKVLDYKIRDDATTPPKTAARIDYATKDDISTIQKQIDEMTGLYLDKNGKNKTDKLTEKE